mgnify:FL=1
MSFNKFITYSNQTQLHGTPAEQQEQFDRAFEQGQYAGLCRGVFDSHAAAAAAAPSSLPLGYDHEQAASMYRDRIRKIFPADYPMIYWLGRAFAGGARQVFDLGGHVGVSYYAYQRYLRYPEGLRWQVNDVPAVNTLGGELSGMLDKLGAISFVDAFDEAAQADILFSSGCLQYLEQTLAQKLAALPNRPKWLLLNLLPLHETAAFWTVQNIETAFCPYRIQQKQAFFDALHELGYRTLDTWENPEKHCEVAFDPEHSLDRYFGAALRLG